MALILVCEKTGKPASMKMEVRTFRGSLCTLEGWQPPKHPCSTGRIYVREKGAHAESAFFPGVCGLKFVEVPDEQV